MASLHPQAPAADGADAARRAAGHLHRHPVRARRAGGADRGRSCRAAVGRRARPRRRRLPRARRASTRSASRRSRSSTASTSRRTSASVEMLGQLRALRPGHAASSSNKDVWELIKEKLPVSISLGLWTFFISYLIAVPLGVAKAVREGTRFDFVTTLIVLVGYAIPGLRARRGAARAVRRRSLHWFPLRGLTSDNWDELSWGAQDRRLPLAHRAAGDGHGARQLRGDDHADQERLPRGDPQAVRADRARQGPGASAGCCGSTCSAMR